MPNLQMTVTWQVGTPLNIAGAATHDPLVDTPLLRQDEMILIPASTIKGKLRAEAERLLRTFGVGERLCESRMPAQMCPSFWWNHPDAPSEDYNCLLCQVFGSPWKPAPLVFSDAKLREVSLEDAAVRPGIGLSRVRGTAQGDLLFFVETTPAIEKGIEFADGRIEGEVPDCFSVALLWASVQQVAAFGNGRSRGRGWLKPGDVSVCVDGETWDKAKVEKIWRERLGFEKRET